MSQLAFDFDTSTEPPQSADAGGLTLEDMARRLEADPGYRVLRRLVPVLDFGPRPAGGDATAGVQHLLILDTETTGLSQASDRIIELAMLLVQVDPSTGHPFGPVETFEGFEDPGMPIPAAARQVTGISDDMVRGQRLDEAQVQALLARADLVVAHNAGFDRPFLEARFPAFAHTPWACSFADIDWKAQGAESARLGALAQRHGWFYDAHRALVDCHALLQVLARPGTDGATTGLGELIAVAQRPGFRLRATGSPFESKDLLKARGYRWDGEARVWSCILGSEAALAAELAWLGTEVYGGRRAAQVEVEVLDALTRYSQRPGQVEVRRLSDA
ncbi:MAG: 3'-5' exonuclease [Hydrogenophaga sp.]|uniref:3'-5' exonuclease n=1 Tax=Hydrogenophaga sp. TaxID=1904254 RepID=UPI000EBE4271|nr:3'-5' exonuclease [Hydrogenophaga sp.]MDD3786487.1 3'-5' exonuclease [Hydrogenophaga sp.]HAJ13065.1 DNA polymerase III subunit epsilon [Comamonadaceae bacterium]